MKGFGTFLGVVFSWLGSVGCLSIPLGIVALVLFVIFPPLGIVVGIIFIIALILGLPVAYVIWKGKDLEEKHNNSN